MNPVTYWQTVSLNLVFWRGPARAYQRSSIAQNKSSRSTASTKRGSRCHRAVPAHLQAMFWATPCFTQPLLNCLFCWFFHPCSGLWGRGRLFPVSPFKVGPPRIFVLLEPIRHGTSQALFCHLPGCPVVAIAYFSTLEGNFPAAGRNSSTVPFSCVSFTSSACAKNLCYSNWRMKDAGFCNLWEKGS